jgi:hypothetical protein
VAAVPNVLPHKLKQIKLATHKVLVEFNERNMLTEIRNCQKLISLGRVDSGNGEFLSLYSVCVNLNPGQILSLKFSYFSYYFYANDEKIP